MATIHRSLRGLTASWPPRVSLLALISLWALIFVTCGPGEQPTPTPTAPAIATPTAAPLATPTPTKPAPIATPTPTTVPLPAGVTVQEGVKRGGILVKSGGAAPAQYDIIQSATSANYFQFAMYNGLLRYNPTNGAKTIIPDLAERWDVSGNGLVYTFYLRKGVKFHDGEPLTADDVVATYMGKIIAPPTGVLSPRKGLFDAVEKVEAVDSLTVRFTLKRPSAILIPAIAISHHAILSKKTLEKYNYDLRTVSDYPGTGAFRNKKLVFKERWELEKNPDYWNKGLPYLDGIVETPAGGGVGTGAEILLAALATGKVDYTTIFQQGTGFTDLVKRQDKLQYTIVNSSNHRRVNFNQSRAPWKDPQVRLAVHLVVDRQSIAEAIQPSSDLVFFGGYWLPVGTKWALSNEELEKKPGYRRDKSQDIAEAKRLMAAAGYSNGIKNVNFVVIAGRYEAEIIQPAMAQQLKDALGIEGTMKTTTNPYDDMAKGEFDIGIVPGLGVTDDPSELWRIWFTPGGGQNYGQWSNPEFTSIVDQLDLATDFQKRLDLVRKGEAILEKDPPVLTIGWNSYYSVWRKELKGGYFEKYGLAEGGPTRMDLAWLDR